MKELRVPAEPAEKAEYAELIVKIVFADSFIREIHDPRNFIALRL